MTDSFDIKSAQLPLMSLLPKISDLRQVAEDLLTSYGGASDNADFFDNDGVIIDCSKVKGKVQADDLSALMQALLECKLKPLAFRSTQAQDQAMATTLGLVIALAEPARNKTTTEANKGLAKQPVREVIKEVVREIPGPSTLVVDKPVRSGQKIYARGADLVLLAMVNQGAEVVADGNIHVYAPLRGKAMAGASGNIHARIFSTCLEPELISIAGVYRTSENPLASEVQGKAAQVRLSMDGQEKLLFEPLHS